ncbi:hypothetical protein Ocin01_18263 [Orchesella cincta]|uniref:Uncharacterized protein n=1 Tax=Orchesella cincta TaxID=48709 RepID=A0A1D2M675_ORCCI|nr:hypothetical protein Ocin01_18263 [Orchesella cincta]
MKKGLHMSSMFWGILYVWSKVFFLADTFFLVLLKKRIHPFHIVHHTLAVIIPPQIMPFGEHCKREHFARNNEVRATLIFKPTKP